MAEAISGVHNPLGEGVVLIPVWMELTLTPHT